MNSHEFAPKQDAGKQGKLSSFYGFPPKANWDQNTEGMGNYCSRKWQLQKEELQYLGRTAVLSELYTPGADSGCGWEGTLGNGRPVERFSVLTPRRLQKAEDVGEASR